MIKISIRNKIFEMKNFYIILLLIAIPLGFFIGSFETKSKCIERNRLRILNTLKEVGDKRVDEPSTRLWDSSSRKQRVSVWKTIIEETNYSEIENGQSRESYLAIKAALDECGIEYKE